MSDIEFMDTYQTNRSKDIVCWNCSGIGEHRGGGMLICQCQVCCGSGFIDKDLTPVVDEDKYKDLTAKIDKRSKSYKQSINELVKLGLTKEQAELRISEGATK